MEFTSNEVISNRIIYNQEVKRIKDVLFYKKNKDIFDNETFTAGEIYFLNSFNEKDQDNKHYVIILSSSNGKNVFIAPIFLKSANSEINENKGFIKIGIVNSINEYKFVCIHKDYLQMVPIEKLETYINFKENYIDKIGVNTLYRVYKDLSVEWLKN